MHADQQSKKRRTLLLLVLFFSVIMLFDALMIFNRQELQTYQSKAESVIRSPEIQISSSIDSLIDQQQKLENLFFDGYMQDVKNLSTELDEAPAVNTLIDINSLGNSFSLTNIVSLLEQKRDEMIDQQEKETINQAVIKWTGVKSRFDSIINTVRKIDTEALPEYEKKIEAVQLALLAQPESFWESTNINTLIQWETNIDRILEGDSDEISPTPVAVDKKVLGAYIAKFDEVSNESGNGYVAKGLAGLKLVDYGFKIFTGKSVLERIPKVGGVFRYDPGNLIIEGGRYGIRSMSDKLRQRGIKVESIPNPFDKSELERRIDNITPQELAKTLQYLESINNKIDITGKSIENIKNDIKSKKDIAFPTCAESIGDIKTVLSCAGKKRGDMCGVAQISNNPAQSDIFEEKGICEVLTNSSGNKILSDDKKKAVCFCALPQKEVKPSMDISVTPAPQQETKKSEMPGEEPKIPPAGEDQKKPPAGEGEKPVGNQPLTPKKPTKEDLDPIIASCKLWRQQSKQLISQAELQKHIELQFQQANLDPKMTVEGASTYKTAYQLVEQNCKKQSYQPVNWN